MHMQRVTASVLAGPVCGGDRGGGGAFEECLPLNQTKLLMNFMVHITRKVYQPPKPYDWFFPCGIF